MIAESTQSVFHLRDWLPVFFNLFVVIIGWVIILGHAKKLATRNEAHSIVQKADDILKEINELGRAYWCCSVPLDSDQAELSKQFADEIGTQISSLRMCIDLLSKAALIFS